jgi:hypothetical protein
MPWKPSLELPQDMNLLSDGARRILPASPKPWRNAAITCPKAPGDALLSHSITGIGGGCAVAASGHAAAPLSSVMNSRLLTRPRLMPRSRQPREFAAAAPPRRAAGSCRSHNSDARKPWIADQDHSRVPIAVAARFPGGHHQALDFGRCQVVAGAN